MGGAKASKKQARAGNSRATPKFGLVRLIQHLVRRHRLLLNRISRAEELADTISCDLEWLEANVAAGVAEPGSAESTAAARREALRAVETLRQTAESGTLSLELKLRSDGSAEVRVAAGKQFPLPPILASLLSILSADSGQNENGDDLIGWKTLEEVALLLEKREGRPFTRHAVIQQVYRLRKELFRRGGVNPFLVQTNRRLGVRFALRRQKVPVIGVDQP